MCGHDAVHEHGLTGSDHRQVTQPNGKPNDQDQNLDQDSDGPGNGLVVKLD